jgi:hypothetical protein
MQLFDSQYKDGRQSQEKYRAKKKYQVLQARFLI